jgi:hypothetical protein
MKSLWHFVRRDFRDSLVIWAMIAILSAVGLTFISRAPERLGSVTLGYAYFFFFLIYLSQIWNGVFGRAIPREYILSLPISRTGAFWIMWARSLVGLFPLLSLLIWHRDDVKFVLRAAAAEPNELFIGQSLSDPIFGVFLAGAVWMFMTIFANAQTSQAMLITAKRQKRYWPWIKYFASLSLDMAALGLWVALFTGRVPAVAAVGLALVCAAYSTFKTRLAYVHWMWGADARFWRPSNAEQ